MESPKRRRQETHPRAAAFALLAAVLAVVVAVCAEPGGGPAAPEAPEDPEGYVRLDSIDGWEAGDVAADGDDDDEEEEDGYTCDDAEDCARKCPVPEKDGWTTGCTCTKRADGHWYCEVRRYPPGQGPGEEGDSIGGGGGGCGSGGTGGIDEDDPPMRCQPHPMPVELGCTNLFPAKGGRVDCEAKPKKSGYDTEKTYYEWSVDCIQYWKQDTCAAEQAGSGRRFKKWGGNATTDAAIRVHISYSPPDQDTIFTGVASVSIKVRSRGWNAGRWSSNATMEYPVNPPRGKPWGKKEWGKFDYRPRRHPPPLLSTKSGSGPWKGTHYLKNEPTARMLYDFVYVHPDLTYDGPLYAGADQTCGDDAPDIPSADVERVNWSCGDTTRAAWEDLKDIVERHELDHQKSYNLCIDGGMQSALDQLEGMAASKAVVKYRARQKWGMMWAGLEDAAFAGLSGATSPDKLWHHRAFGSWRLAWVTGGGHKGTWGCPTVTR